MSEQPGHPDRAPEAEGAGSKPRYETYWSLTETGSRFSSRPIVIDGLGEAETRIQLAPRVRFVNGRPMDDSYRAVEQAATQFVKALTLEQLVMAAVALQVHMRIAKEHYAKKKRLQERWTLLARRMKKIRLEKEHLEHAEAAHRERLEEAARRPEPAPELDALLQLQEREVADRRLAFREEESSAGAEWTELETEDAELLKNAPHLEQTEDLQFPCVLWLVSPQEGSRRRSTASAMHALVEALQKPLSRTDQMLLEIALRRCIQAHATEAERRDPGSFERRHLRAAEKEFGAEFEWAGAYLPEVSRTGIPAFSAPGSTPQPS